MATLNDAGDMNIARWTPEERAAKQAQLAAQSQALRNKRAGLASAGGPSLGLQQPASGPLANAQQKAPAPVVSLGSVTATPAAAPSTQPATLSGYQPTGIGQGAQGGQIVSRVGPGGVVEFSNQAADQAQAQGLASVGNGVAQQAGVRDKTYADLGSAGNIGNGLGGFSQNTAGDAALANSRFERANEIRRDAANQDRLDLALARQGNANSVTVVGDSSRGPSLADVVARRQGDAQGNDQRQSRLEDVALAQNAIATTQAQRNQQRARDQAARLEGLQSAATAPGATAEDVRNYQLAADPAGYLKNQQGTGLTQLKLEGQQLDNQIKQQTLSGAETKAQQSADDRQRKNESTAATFDQALASVDTLLGTQQDPNNPNGPNIDEDPGLAKALGPLDGLAPTLPGTPAADFEARLDTLKAQTFLPQVQALKGAGALSDAEGKKLSDSIGALSTKMSEQAFRASLKDVKSTLAAARERAAPSSQSSPAATGATRVANASDYNALPSGASYIDPNGNQRRKP